MLMELQQSIFIMHLDHYLDNLNTSHTTILTLNNRINNYIILFLNDWLNKNIVYIKKNGTTSHEFFYRSSRHNLNQMINQFVSTKNDSEKRLVKL